MRKGREGAGSGVRTDSLRTRSGKHPRPTTRLKMGMCLDGLK